MASPTDSINLKTFLALEKDINALFDDIIFEIEKILPSDGSITGVNPDTISSAVSKVVDEGMNEYQIIVGKRMVENVEATKLFLLGELGRQLNQYSNWARFEQILESRIDFISKELGAKYLLRKSYIDGITIGERIKLIKKGSQRVIRSLTFQSVQAGEGPFQLAKKIENYLAPTNNLVVSPWSILRREKGLPVSYRPDKVPAGSVKYNALRIARTELAETNRLTVMQSTKNQPYIKGYKWNLSRAHPKKDICDEYATRDNGLGPGVYTYEEFSKLRTHPQCLCFPTTIRKSDEELSQILDSDTKALARQYQKLFNPNMDGLFVTSVGQ